jgi:flagellar motor switch protein FliN/FliY
MSGTDGEMLTQDALDAMLAVMSTDTGDAFDNETMISDEPPEEAAVPALNLAQESAAAAHSAKATAASSSPSLSFMSFTDPPVNASSTGSAGFDRVQDISLEITVELGRTRLLIKDILELTNGSIIELEKIAGEPVDLLANGLLIARGEVVVVEDSFGVRVTQVITAGSRKDLAANAMHKSMI